MFTLFMTIFSP